MTAHELGGFVLWLLLWGGFCGLIGYLLGLDVADRARAKRNATRAATRARDRDHPCSTVRVLRAPISNKGEHP